MLGTNMINMGQIPGEGARITSVDAPKLLDMRLKRSLKRVAFETIHA